MTYITSYLKNNAQRYVNDVNLEASTLLFSSQMLGEHCTHYWTRNVIVNIAYLCIAGAPLTTSLVRHVHWCNCDKNITGVNNDFLVGFRFRCTRWNLYLVPLLGQEAMTRQATDFREYNIIIWLNEPRITMIPNYLLIKENFKPLSCLP